VSRLTLPVPSGKTLNERNKEPMEKRGEGYSGRGSPDIKTKEKSKIVEKKKSQGMAIVSS